MICKDNNYFMLNELIFVFDIININIKVYNYYVYVYLCL